MGVKEKNPNNVQTGFAVCREGMKMKIAVSASGKDLDSAIDPRFGRCAYFLVVETEDMGVEVFDNENNSLGGGAGIQSAQFVASGVPFPALQSSGGSCPAHGIPPNEIRVPPWPVSDDGPPAWGEDPPPGPLPPVSHPRTVTGRAARSL